jgi:hypothetical protein
MQCRLGGPGAWGGGGGSLRSLRGVTHPPSGIGVECVHLSKNNLSINSINYDNFFDKFDKFDKYDIFPKSKYISKK